MFVLDFKYIAVIGTSDDNTERGKVENHVKMVHLWHPAKFRVGVTEMSG